MSWVSYGFRYLRLKTGIARAPPDSTFRRLLPRKGCYVMQQVKGDSRASVVHGHPLTVAALIEKTWPSCECAGRGQPRPVWQLPSQRLLLVSARLYRGRPIIPP